MAVETGIPELIRLKQALQNRLNLYTDKPELNTIVNSLQPLTRVYYLNQLVKKYKSEAGELKEEYADAEQATKVLFSKLDTETSVFQTKIPYIVGEMDSELSESFTILSNANLQKILLKYSSWKIVNDDVQKIELEKDLAFYTELYALQFFTFTDVINLRQDDITDSPTLIAYFTYLKEQLLKVAQIKPFTVLWEGIESRRFIYSYKPLFQNWVNDIVPNSYYDIVPPRNVDDYAKGDKLAIFNSLKGPILLVKVKQGKLPYGTTLNTTTGNIEVSEPSQLSATLYLGIKIEVTDSFGSKTIHALNLEMLQDVESVYTVLSPKQISQYQNNEVLAQVTDENGPVSSATILSGTLPPGAGLDTSTGDILVIDHTKLKPETYKVRLEVRDIYGGTTQTTIEIQLDAVDYESVYTISPAKNIDFYTNGFVMAAPYDQDGNIVNASIIGGALPLGTGLNAVNGVITVTDSTQLVPGSSIVTIITTDTTGQTTIHNLELVVLPDNEAVYTMLPVKHYNLYGDGDIIATVTDADGTIETASVVSGTLPDGISLIINKQNSYSISNILGLSNPIPIGYLVVTNKTLLQPTLTDVDILTVDISGGKSTNTVTILMPQDSEAIYTVEPARMPPSYKNGDKLAYANDPDGNIVHAEITLGSLPPGTSINTTTGEITVTNRSTIVGGSYTLGILTRDSQQGETSSVITIVIKTMPAPKEFIKGICGRLGEIRLRHGNILTNTEVINRVLIDFTSIILEKVCSDFNNPGGETDWINGNKDSQIKSDMIAITNPINSAIVSKKNELNLLSPGSLKDRAQKDMDYLTELYNEVVVNLIQMTGYRTSDLPAQANNPVNELYDTLRGQMQSMNTVQELSALRGNIGASTFSSKPRANSKIAALLT